MSDVTDLLVEEFERREIYFERGGADYVDDCFEGVAAAVCAVVERASASAPRWIPVSERLPAEDAPVLAFCPASDRDNLHEGPPGMYVGYVELIGAKLAVAFYDGWCGHAYGVTHWMPLPEPPK